MKMRFQKLPILIFPKFANLRAIGAYFINGLTGVEFHIDVSEPLDLVYNNEEWNE